MDILLMEDLISRTFLRGVEVAMLMEVTMRELFSVGLGACQLPALTEGGKHLELMSFVEWIQTPQLLANKEGSLLRVSNRFLREDEP